MFGIEEWTVDHLWLLIIILIIGGVVTLTGLFCANAGVFHTIEVKAGK